MRMRADPQHQSEADAPAAGDADGRKAEAGGGRSLPNRSLPNVGPPPPRLDWRKRRS